MWAAARRADADPDGLGSARSATSSTSSTCAPEKVVVVHNAIDERFWVPPRRTRKSRACASATSSNKAFVLYAGNIKPHKNLVRLIEAFDRAAGPGREPAAPHHRRRDLQAAGPAPAVHRLKLHRHVRFLGYMPDETLAVLYRLRGRVRVSVALRRVRPAAARGDGQRCAGRDVEHVVAAGGGRRRGGARRSARRQLDRGRHRARARPDHDARRRTAAQGPLRAREFSWERSVTQDQGALRGRERAAAGRRRDRCPGPRLAHGHAEARRCSSLCERTPTPTSNT